VSLSERTPQREWGYSLKITDRGVNDMHIESMKGNDANGNGKNELRSDALQSWKEIAAYLKRGVRTAQRWERCAGLPVRRPRAGDRSPVFAFPQEIDQWLHSRPTRTFN
jgi:hypothetical protein